MRMAENSLTAHSMEYNWHEVYMGYYKEPLMKSSPHGFLGIRIQSTDRSQIMCNECGKFYKRLHSKHLNKHGMTMDEYREKHWYQKTTAMIADQESINISKRILWKAHSIHLNTEALEKRKEAFDAWVEIGKWKNSNERQNKLGTCHDQIADRLKSYIERFWRPPTYNAMWEDGKAIYSLLKHRYGDINEGFKEYWLPIKKLIPWECVEYHFQDSTIIEVWYKHDNWEQLFAKIKSTSSLFKPS